MRVTIHVDSATTEQIRPLLACLSEIGKHETATVGLNGPECWVATTPPLTENQFAQVFAKLVKVDGRTIAETLKAVEDAA